MVRTDVFFEPVKVDRSMIQSVEQHTSLSFLLYALSIASFIEDGLGDRMEAQEDEHATTA